MMQSIEGDVKMDEIKAGDVVQLKSGGPNMTVLMVTKPTDIAYCEYMNNGVKKAEDFSLVVLKKIPDGSVWIPVIR
jgi:uncharacterized protein YodC (DUF2158 family)